MSSTAGELDAEALYQDLLTRMRADWAQLPQPAYLVGVASGGVEVARRLARDLGASAAAGVISSAMHRDDFAQRGLAGAAMQNDLPFDVEGAHVVLVDDVLHTGRTVRAVINELFDYGRPASVMLAVLVDRGQRQLPVCANWSACSVELPADQSLQLKRDEAEELQFVMEAAR